jgi:site-specific recombinase XerD
MTANLTSITLRRMADPRLGPELTKYCERLQQWHFAPIVIDRSILLTSRALPRLRGKVYTREQVRRAFIADAHDTAASILFHGSGAATYCRFLQERGRLKPAVDRGPQAALRCKYARFLQEVRGLSLSSQVHHATVVRDLLARAPAPGQPLRSLSAKQVEDYVMLRSLEISRHSLQHDVAYVRAFLRYCWDNEYTRSRLDGVDNVTTYRGELPPKAMRWPDVLELLDGIDLSKPIGLRDYTILHIFAYCGLRPSEVAILRLGSIDWKRRILHVTQCKTKSQLTLPLLDETLRVLRQYLEGGRTRFAEAEDHLFLRAAAPIGPITRYTICDVFDFHADVAGVRTGHSVYSLRHALAMRLLSRGVGVKAIGDVLGHRSIETTCTYLRPSPKALEVFDAALARYLATRRALGRSYVADENSLGLLRNFLLKTGRHDVDQDGFEAWRRQFLHLSSASHGSTRLAASAATAAGPTHISSSPTRRALRA